MADDSPRKGLGRGLSALLGDDDTDYAALDKVRAGRDVPIEHLRANPFQPRHRFGEEDQESLVASIREHGILQPILVRRVISEGEDAGSYEIIAGERRWRAAQEARLTRVPVLIRDFDDSEALEIAPEATRLDTLYDVCHNIAKLETFQIDGRPQQLCVHRKGATRAYPPGHPETPAPYRHVGQPVLVPGDMGRYSYVLVGTARAMRETFGSTCHGAGRRMSRRQATRVGDARRLLDELRARGIHVRAAGLATVAEERPEAYKDVADIVRIVHEAGVSTRVAQLRPLAVIKG